MIRRLGEVWFTVWEDAPLPEVLFRHLASRKHVAWLDSASNPRGMGRPEGLGRWSYMAADPWKVIRGRVGEFVLEGGEETSVNPWTIWENQQGAFELESSMGDWDLPPFKGGWIFSLGYELGGTIERLPRAVHDEFQTPDLWAGAYDCLVAWDHEKEKCFILASGRSAGEHQSREGRALKCIEDLKHLANVPVPDLITPSDCQVIPHRLSRVPLNRHPDLKIFSHFDRREFEDAVARAVEYIHAGDCFQVNLAQRLLSRLSVAPEELYLRLRQVNPAPFAGFLKMGDAVVASASPERFLRLGREGWVETRPIKGTRRRGIDLREDEALARELLDSAKDRAENVMIVDLLRNDLGRVCAPGSISVDEVCRLESYPTVHHMVSVVRGKLASKKTPWDLLRATFPGGSVTGAPKIRSMEIITELESVARGPYCGSLGWLGDNGQMDTNILIRTFIAKGGWVEFAVGGGIVADSKPALEYEETLHKAEGLLRALEEFQD